MVKKTKDDVPNPNSVSNRDIIQRLSFLYQASVYLNSIPVTSPTQPPPDAEAGPSTSVVSTSTSHARPRKRKRSFRKETTQNLSKCYVDSMNVVGKKTTVKMSDSCSICYPSSSHNHSGILVSSVLSAKDVVTYLSQGLPRL